MGTLLDGTLTPPANGDGTGRIKFGTESNGGFRNIAISNCVFSHCRGLAIESVDGAIIEDVTISNIAMEHLANAPIFIRLGARMRGPEGIPIGAIRRVTISNVVAAYANSRSASVMSGIPDHPIEDLTISDVRMLYNGGDAAPPSAGSSANAGGRGPGRPLAPPDPFGIPEAESAYPEPNMFGSLPAYGMYLRHVRRVAVRQVDLSVMQSDARPPFALYDVHDAEFTRVRAEVSPGAPMFQLNDVSGFSTERCAGVPDMQRDTVTTESVSAPGAPRPGSSYSPAAPAEHVPDSANTPIPAATGVPDRR